MYNSISLKNNRLHGLQVISLLNLGLSLLAHSLPELLSLISSRNIINHASAFLPGQINGLVLDGDLGGQSFQVSFGEELSFESLLALGGDSSLLLGFGYSIQLVHKI